SVTTWYRSGRTSRSASATWRACWSTGARPSCGAKEHRLRRHPYARPTSDQSQPMITLLTGNSKILLTIDEKGQWSNLYYPYAGQYQHLRSVKLGIFDEDEETFAWLGDDADW